MLFRSAWFGAQTPNLRIQVGTTVAQTNAATFVSQSVPPTMAAGSVNPISIVMLNSGNTTWTPDAFALASINPNDNAAWGTNRIGLARNVAPGASATFTFNTIAPAAPGTNNFQWQMIQNTTGRFGEVTPNMPVVVTLPPTNNAQFFGPPVIASTTVGAGTGFVVTLNFKNTGNTSWPAGSTYRLGSRNPTDNTTWGFARVALATPVAPGETPNIVIKARAPAVPGTYDFQWQMLQEKVGWFGDLSQNVSITVTP